MVKGGQRIKCFIVAAVVIISGFSVLNFTNDNIYAEKSVDDISKEIDALQSQIGDADAKANELNQQAKTLQGELESLNNDKKLIKSQITKYQALQSKLADEISQTQRKIEDNKKALGSTLVEMAVGDDMTPLERIAGSQNISTALDGFEYKSAVKNSLTKTVQEIKESKKVLEDKKAKNEEALRDQKFKETELAAKETKQQEILQKTKGEESKYQDYIKGQQDQIAKLEAERERLAAFNRQYSQDNGINVPSGGTSGGGGYPAVWANAPMNSYVDSWGLYSRQCVSYAAWKVWSTGRFVPHFAGRGNAYEWPSTTAAHGIAHGSSPKRGSVAIDPNVGAGYGHAMYVEEVYGNGTIKVSDYNYYWDGLYREYTRSSGGLTYIYF